MRGAGIAAHVGGRRMVDQAPGRSRCFVKLVEHERERVNKTHPNHLLCWQFKQFGECARLLPHSGDPQSWGVSPVKTLWVHFW